MVYGLFLPKKRFLSLDPLAAEYVSWSAYNYVLGNPVMLIDPTGKSAEGGTDPPSVTTLSKVGLNQVVSEIKGTSSTVTNADGSKTTTNTLKIASVVIEQDGKNISLVSNNATTETITQTYTEKYNQKTGTWERGNTKETSESKKGIDKKEFSNIDFVADKVVAFGIKDGMHLLDYTKNATTALGYILALGSLPFAGAKAVDLGMTDEVLSKMGVPTGGASITAWVSHQLCKTDGLIMSIGNSASKQEASFNNKRGGFTRKAQNFLYDWTLGWFW
jgi:hypothetical protein